MLPMRSSGIVTVILEKDNETIRKKQETARKVTTLKSVSKEAFLNKRVQRPMEIDLVRGDLPDAFRARKSRF
jgi:hypothetical protein